MRTDAKVGLICFLALAIAVVAYFVVNHENKPAVTRGSTEATASLTTATTAPAPGGLVIAPPGASSIASAPTTPSASPPPAYTPALAQTIINPPSATTAPSTPLTITSPGSVPHPLLPPTTTAPAAPTGLTGGTPIGPTGPDSTVPSSLRPGGTDSLLEPRTTISSTPTYGTGSSVGGSTYTIQAGDTLTSIARKNGISLKALQAANPKVDSSHLKIKQVINLPAPGSSTPSSTIGTTPPATTRPSRSSAHSGTTTTTTPPASAAGTSYTVKKGDTLRKIAKAVYGDEAQWKKIFRANRADLDDANDLDIGMVLKLPPK